MTDTTTVRLFDTNDHMVATAPVITKMARNTHMFKWRNRYFQFFRAGDFYTVDFREVPEPYNLDLDATECG